MDLELKRVYGQYSVVRELYNSGQYVPTVVHCNQMEDSLDSLDLYKIQDVSRQVLCRNLRKALLAKLDTIRQRCRAQTSVKGTAMSKKEYK